MIYFLWLMIFYLSVFWPSRLRFLPRSYLDITSYSSLIHMYTSEPRWLRPGPLGPRRHRRRETQRALHAICSRKEKLRGSKPRQTRIKTCTGDTLQKLLIRTCVRGVRWLFLDHETSQRPHESARWKMLSTYVISYQNSDNKYLHGVTKLSCVAGSWFLYCSHQLMTEPNLITFIIASAVPTENSAPLQSHRGISRIAS